MRFFSYPHRGVATTRNALLAEARGEWILFLDADDALAPDALQTLFAHTAQTSRADIILADFVHHTTTSHRCRQTRQPLGWMPASALFHVYPMCTARAIRRSFLEEHGLRFPLYETFEDVLFWYHCALHAPKTYYVPTVVYYYYARAHSLSEHWDVQKFTPRLNALASLSDLAQTQYMRFPDLLICTLQRFLKTIEIAIGPRVYRERKQMLHLVLQCTAQHVPQLLRLSARIRLPWSLKIYLMCYSVLEQVYRIFPRAAVFGLLVFGSLYRKLRVCLGIYTLK